jgi:drug/metabolite transporter (DMT)-like permease
MSDSTKGIILACITAMMWGVLAIALKVALNYLDPYTIVWWRFAASFMFLVGYFVVKSPRSLLILRKPPRLLLLAGFLLGVNFIGFMQGVNYAGPAVTQVVIQAGAITLALVGFLFFKETITPIKTAGFILALIGFVFFYYHQLVGVTYTDNAFQKGIIWTLVGAWSWTGYAILNKILVRKIEPSQVNLILYGLPMLMYLPLVNFQTLFAPHSFGIWLLFIFLAVNTIVAYGGLSMALKYTEANRISIIITLNPIITFIILEILLWINVKWFDSPPMAPLAYIGAILVLAGAVMAIGMRKR